MSSFLSSLRTGQSSLLPQYHHDPPSSIPPPITTRQRQNQRQGQRQHSASPAPRSSTSKWSSPSSAAQALDTLQARSSQLQRQLQKLLDAQAAALIPAGAGLEHADHGSEGSYTPTTTTTTTNTADGASTVGSARRRKAAGKSTKPLSLRAARRGILDAIRELAAIKSAEGKVLLDSGTEAGNIKAELERWTSKKAGLDREIERIEHGDLEESLRNLRREDESMGQEIQELEGRLSDLRNRQRLVRRKIAESQNDVEAKASTFRSSRDILDAQISSFLVNPPESQGDIVTSNEFQRLPKGRRTLEMAKSHYDDAERLMKDRKGDVDTELGALQEGAILWKGIIQQITGFERRLKTEMHRTQGDSLLLPSSPDAHGNESTAQQHSREKNDLLHELDTVLADIETKLELCEDRNWNLLVCCVGAELEALREGREVLRHVLGVSEADQLEEHASSPPPSSSLSSPEKSRWHDHFEKQDHDPLGVQQSSSQRVSDAQSLQNTKLSHEELKGASVYENDGTDEDEDPSPDLLVSRLESA